MQTKSSILETFKTKAPYLLVVAIVFFVYELYLLANSFGADYRIYGSVSAWTAQHGFSFWRIFWLSSEFVGEVALIARFAGASFFLSFSAILLRKEQFILKHFSKAIFFEGIQYVFFVPFIIYLITSPLLTRGYLAAVSYSIQLAIVTPLFVSLFLRIRNSSFDKTEIVRWVSIAGVGFLFALWIKHFIFNLYALPINFQDPALLVGLTNSALTLLFASLILLKGVFPIIRHKSEKYNGKLVGISLVLVGAYFMIYLLVSYFNTAYLSFLTLTELWAISLPILGYSYLKQKND